MGPFTKPRCELCAEVNPQPHTQVVVGRRSATVVRHQPKRRGRS